MEAEKNTNRLTEREKMCLRQWLEHKTAKEIALELGISHYAVEKRLKMARTKLGVGTSIEAARLLANVEGYGRTVPQPADLPIAARAGDRWRPQSIAIGVFAMILCSITAVMLAQQALGGGGVSANAVAPRATRLAEMTRKTFDSLDEDGSGYLERLESPLITIALLEPEGSNGSEAATTLSGQAAEAADPDMLAQFYSEADRDDDGKVSYAEYHQWSVPRLAQMGLDLVSAMMPDS